MYFPKYILLWFIVISPGIAQQRTIPYNERFDSVVVPTLPSGWVTTTNRNAGGDFTTTKSVPLSDSNAVVSTNAAISQTLTSPALDFSNLEADSLIFYERRSGSHNSGVLLEASIDDGISYPYQLTDTLKNPGTTSYVERNIKLPPALSNLPAVGIRWRILGNGTGTTGTIRFDNVTITGRGKFDAAVTAIVFSPQFPTADDSIIIQATIRNNGSQFLNNIPVEFYDDANNDSLPEPGEYIASVTITQSLQPSDTVIAQARIGHLPSGEHFIIVRTLLPEDQNYSNDNKRFVLTIGFKKLSVIINEIMYEPKAGHAEYVELYNRSTQEIDLKDWKLSDVRDTSATSKVHVISQLPLVISSNEYLVIASDSVILKDYPYLMDSSYHLVIKRSGLSLNNSGDDIILSDFTRQTIDSLHYFPAWHNIEVDDVAGRSLERINPNLPGNDQRNWSTSANTFGGTPGRTNSLFTTSIPNNSSLSFSPNPFSPDGERSGAHLPPIQTQSEGSKG